MKKRKTAFLLISAVLIIAVGLGLKLMGQQRQEKLTQPLNNITKKDKIWVITDTHYLATDLYDEGSKFEFIKQTAAGKDLDYQTQRMEALVWQVAQEKPSILIVSGDLTLNGEKKSMEELAEYFQKIQDLGTKVLVIPGNHDISSGWARKYEKDQATVVDQVLPKEFKKIFAREGYQDAYMQDKNSLSYVSNPYKDLWILMLDTNIYQDQESYNSPTTNGRIKAETLKWMAQVMTEARAKNIKVLPVMHHNLVNHNEYLNQGFTLDNAEEVQEFYSKNNMKYNISGHIHAQDIASVTVNKQKIYDISTSSFAILANSIGEITYENQAFVYQRKELDVAQWSVATGQTDPNLLNYRAYSMNLFKQDGERLGNVQMIEEGWYDESYAEIVAEFVGRMNVNFFNGEDYLATVKEQEQLKNEPGYQLIQQNSKGMLKRYIESITSDQDSSDTELKIPLKNQ